MPDRPFAGAEKRNQSFLRPLEQRFAEAVVPRIPAGIETYHLTWLTLVWCAGIVGCGALAAGDRRWLWAVSGLIVLHYLTDFFDGKVGKFRGTGLVTWGFYLDHVFDYLFLAAITIAYAFVLPASAHLPLLLVFAAYAGFMVNSFLSFSATDEFEISFFRLGPTEFRMALIVINGLVATYGTARMEAALPWVAGGAFAMLAVGVYQTQRVLWRQDMARKARR